MGGSRLLAGLEVFATISFLLQDTSCCGAQGRMPDVLGLECMHTPSSTTAAMLCNSTGVLPARVCLFCAGQ